MWSYNCSKMRFLCDSIWIIIRCIMKAWIRYIGLVYHQTAYHSSMYQWGSEYAQNRWIYWIRSFDFMQRTHYGVKAALHVIYALHVAKITLSIYLPLKTTRGREVMFLPSFLFACSNWDLSTYKMEIICSTNQGNIQLRGETFLF